MLRNELFGSIVLNCVGASSIINPFVTSDFNYVGLLNVFQKCDGLLGSEERYLFIGINTLEPDFVTWIAFNNLPFNSGSQHRGENIARFQNAGLAVPAGLTILASTVF